MANDLVIARPSKAIQGKKYIAVQWNLIKGYSIFPSYFKSNAFMFKKRYDIGNDLQKGELAKNIMQALDESDFV